MWDIGQKSVVKEKRLQSFDSLYISVQDLETSVLLDLIRFSKLLKVQRITTYVMQFINIKIDTVKYRGLLSSTEILSAELFSVKFVQWKHFA